MFSCLRRYDEAGKDYDAILQDDPTNTVSPRKEKGKTPSAPLGSALRSHFFGRLSKSAETLRWRRRRESDSHWPP